MKMNKIGMHVNIDEFTSYIWLEHDCHTEQCWNDVHRLNSKTKHD